MKEAVGQTISLQVILVFLVFLNAFLAFSVNYTKAFRVKNKVINELEQNEGFNSTAQTNIINYITKVGYNIRDVNGDVENVGSCMHGVCIKPHCVGTVGNSNESGTCPTNVADSKNYRIYYSVTTYINIDLPIINNILNQEWNIFKVQGDTSTIYVDYNSDLTSWS